MIAILLSTVALAGDIPAWSQSTWSDGQDVSGWNGWQTGYADDAWKGFAGGEQLAPRTDDGPGWFDDRGYGEGGPLDNWLLKGPSFRSGAITAEMGNRDLDTVGLVLSHDGGNEGYLLIHSRKDVPRDVGRVRDPTLVLGRLRGGGLRELGRAAVADLTDTPTLVRFERDGDDLRVWFGGDLVFDTLDVNPVGPGQAGVYSFESGDGPAFFESVTVTLLDGDDDGVADDTDGCPDVANPGQLDRDADGIQDACDPDPPAPVDSGTPSGDDTANPSDDTGPRPDDDDTALSQGPTGTPPANGDFELLFPDERVRARCGCGPGAPHTGWLALAGLALLRRRRR